MRFFLLLTILHLFYTVTTAQNVGIGTSTPSNSAKLDISSTNSGILIPRMSSTERTAIANPVKGLMVFDNEKNLFMYWDGLQWKSLVTGNSSTGTQKLLASGDAGTTRLGRGASISGNTAAVAAYKEGNQADVVYIYEKSNDGSWVQQLEITPPNPQITDDFGHALDMEGDYLVIGDPNRRDVNGQRKGMVYVYRKTNNVWNLEASIERPLGPANESFGWDVAISTTTSQGPMIAIGAPRSLGDFVIADAGKVLLYKKAGNAWQYAQTVSSLDFTSNSQAGYSLDLEGDLLAVGTPFRNDGRGGVFLFRYNPAINHWDKEFGETNFEEDDAGGYSVSISGGKIAVGAPSFKSSAQGKVFVLYKKTAYWSSLYISTPAKIIEGGYPRFGAHVCLDNDNLMVGAPSYVARGAYEVNGSQPGKAVLYQLLSFQNNFRYAIKQVWQSDYFQADDQYAYRTGISGNNLLITHPLFSTETTNAVGTIEFGSLQ